MQKTILPRIGLTVLILLVASGVMAKLVIYSFEEIVLKSSAIVIGKVESVSGGWIRKPRAKVSLVRIIKEAIPGSSFELYYGQPIIQPYAHEDFTEMKPSHIYLMFLVPFKTGYRLRGASSGYYEVDARQEICHEGKRIPVKAFICKILDIVSQSDNSGQ